METIWSTADVPPWERRAYWIEAICNSFIRMDCELPRDRPFFGEIRSDLADTLLITQARTMAQHVTRSPRHIAQAGDARFHACVLQSGRALFTQDGDEIEVGPGDLMLFESTRPMSWQFDGDIVQTVLQAPCTDFLRRLGAPSRLIATRVDGSAGLGAVLSPVIRDLPAHIGQVPAAARERIAGNLLDLVASALVSSRDDAPLSTELTLARIKFWIETHLAEELSADVIAARCRLSVRHLNRLFEREGTSLMRYVWEQRLRRCHEEITAAASRDRSISAIAFAAGFNDLSHFSRAFRARYGLSPREARLAAAP